MVVRRIEPIPLPLGGDGGVVSDGDGERTLLGAAGVDHRSSQRGHDRRPVRVVELDALVFLEEAAHRRPVAVGLIDVGIVREGDRATQPCGQRVAGRSGVARRVVKTGKRIDRRTETALRATELLASDQHRVGGRERRGVEALDFPPGVRVTEPLVTAQGRHIPPPSIRREAADVFVREQRVQGVGRALRRWAHRVADGGPVPPIVGRDLESVSGGDHRGVSPHRDAPWRDVLPLRTELFVRPVPPGRAAIEREAPAVSHRAVPDLASRSEGDRLYEVHRDRALIRRIVTKSLPFLRSGRQAVHPLTVRPDPDPALRILCGRENVNPPPSAVRKGRHCVLRHGRYWDQGESDEDRG